MSAAALLPRGRLPLLLLALLATGACAPRPDTSGLPNLVLVSLDTTRADHLGSYGYFRDTSPNFDAFAAGSILFERAIAPMATTLPTHISLFTAAYPLEHGVLANLLHGGQRFVPARGLRSFVAVAREAGYRTAGFVSASPLKSDSGVAEGFETFEEPADIAYQRRGSTTTKAVLGWLDTVGAGPFLLFVHYYDAHWPFVAPEPYGSMFHTDAHLEHYIAERRIARTTERGGVGVEDSRETINAYDGELRYQDAELGRLLDALRARPDWNETVVVIFGDHGEGLSQHGLAAHGSTWNEQVHAPLLMRVPGQEPRRVGVPLSLVDVLPTLLGLLDLPAFEAFQRQASGRDVLAPDGDPLPVLSQDTGRHRIATDPLAYRVALTTDRWKYFRIEEGGELRDELYDLDRDPFELRDVAQDHPEATARLRDQLVAQMESQRQRALENGVGEARPADPGIVQQLRALGYVEGPEADAPAGAHGGS